jgi:methylmalonyl-CoA mutase
LPGFRVINVSGNTFANAGSTIVQELAFSLASGADYLAELTDRGISIDKIVPRMQFTFAVGSNYFFEIAKMRAARLLWSKIVEQFKPENKDSQKMFIHATTLNWNKTVYDAHVNLLRTTTEAMSAIIGGIDSLAVAPFDVAYKASDDFSRRIARNQQIVLKEESYMNKIVDPAAGSYYIESITDQIASAAWALFKEVEELGGFMKAVQKNFIQDSIETVRKKKEDDIANRKVTILGTNQYPNPNETALDKIQEEEATTGKVDGKGNYKKLEFSRAAEELEEIRLATEIFVNEGNPMPKVFLFTIGNLAMRKARASFATNFFRIAGYEIIDNPGFKTVDEGVKAAIDSKAEVIVICSSDDEYPEFAPAIAKAIKEKASERTVILAGYPKEIIDLLKAAGVDDFIHIKTNTLNFLQKIQRYLGVIE